MTTTFVVDAVHRVAARPWLLLTGRLLEGSLAKGDSVTVQNDGKPDTATEVAVVEFHSPPGTTTIGVPESAADHVTVGTRLTRA
ncbi:MAG TPA: hypothetical protein VF062_15555 [Candidatus Limnocylindrales bacterium]